MDKQIVVSIGIQARSTSTRLPNKVTELVGGKMVIDHVIDACKNAAEYINRYSYTNKTTVGVYVLVPKGDPLKQILSSMEERVIEGSAADVLSRYVHLQKETNSQYIVRITADCPLIPPFLIFKCINVAIKNGYDYVTNAGDLPETIRLTPDGHDAEVLSSRAIEYLDKLADKPEYREHVTSLLRKQEFPQELKAGVLMGHIDLSELKLSLDTEEDLKKIREQFDSLQSKLARAKKKYGKFSIHRY